MIGFEIWMDLGAQEVHIIGDSQLVLQQLIGEYKCNSLLLAPYYTTSTQLLDFSFIMWILNMCIGNLIGRRMS